MEIIKTIGDKKPGNRYEEAVELARQVNRETEEKARKEEIEEKLGKRKPEAEQEKQETTGPDQIGQRGSKLKPPFEIPYNLTGQGISSPKPPFEIPYNLTGQGISSPKPPLIPDKPNLEILIKKEYSSGKKYKNNNNIFKTNIDKLPKYLIKKEFYDKEKL